MFAQVTGICVDLRGDVKLTPVKLEREYNSFKPDPCFFDCLECKTEAHAYGSIGAYDQTEDNGFVMYHSDPHRKNCIVKHNFHSSLMGNDCNCGLYENCKCYRGKFLFIKVDYHHPYQLRPGIEYTYEQQLKACNYINATEDDLERIHKVIRRSKYRDFCERHCVIL